MAHKKILFYSAFGGFRFLTRFPPINSLKDYDKAEGFLALFGRLKIFNNKVILYSYFEKIELDRKEIDIFKIAYIPPFYTRKGVQIVHHKKNLDPIIIFTPFLSTNRIINRAKDAGYKIKIAARFPYYHFYS
ncbi:MAG: hypothetical protein AABX85_03445 [Nanoarchaeota archaeon]